MNTPVRNEYKVSIELTAIVEAIELPEPTTFDKLEDAIRYWDGNVSDISARLRYWPGADIMGGIEVKQWDAKGNVVRDGWILHLFQKHTYLNPGLVDAYAA